MGCCSEKKIVGGGVIWSQPADSAAAAGIHASEHGASRPLSSYTRVPTTEWQRITPGEQGTLRVYSTWFQKNNALSRGSAHHPIEFVFVELEVERLVCVCSTQGLIDCADVVPGSRLSKIYDDSWLTSADVPRIRRFFDDIRTYNHKRGSFMPISSHMTNMMSIIHTVEADVDALLDEMDPPSQTHQSQQFQDTGYLGSATSSGRVYAPPEGAQVDRVYPPIARFIKLKHMSNLSTSKFIVPVSLGTQCKPHGVLWLACGNEWKRFWAEQGGAAYEATYTIDTDRLILLDSPGKVEMFHRTYGLNKNEDAVFDLKVCIDWDRVRSADSSKCGVFLPRPAHYAGLPGAEWVYFFDVCSAALWSDACITHVTRQRKVKVL